MTNITPISAIAESDRQMSMFGCTVADLEAMEAEMMSKGMNVLGMMSDAQHEIGMGRAEAARQTLNRAKWLASRLLPRDDAGRML